MISFVKTVILYVLVMFAIRLMGKRTIGEMHPTELVVSIMISDLATIPLQERDNPLIEGIIPIFTLVILELFFAYLILKSRGARRVLAGRSCHVVNNGKLLEHEMRKLRVTVDDIEEQIRISGYTSLKEVSEVVIETNGQVSVIGKNEATLIPFLIISDGKLRKKEMERAHISEKDVEKALLKNKLNSPNEVLYMSAINSQIVHMQKKGDVKNT